MVGMYEPAKKCAVHINDEDEMGMRCSEACKARPVDIGSKRFPHQHSGRMHSVIANTLVQIVPQMCTELLSTSAFFLQFGSIPRSLSHSCDVVRCIATTAQLKPL